MYKGRIIKENKFMGKNLVNQIIKDRMLYDICWSACAIWSNYTVFHVVGYMTFLFSHKVLLRSIKSLHHLLGHKLTKFKNNNFFLKKERKENKEEEETISCSFGL